MSSSHVSAISRIEYIGRPRGALVQMNSPLRGSKDWKLRVKPQSRNSLWSCRLKALRSTHVPPSSCSMRNTSPRSTGTALPVTGCSVVSQRFLP